MKRTLLCFMIVLVLLSCQVLPAFAYEPSSWAVDSVNGATNFSIIPDTFSDTAFQAPITRLDFVTIAINLYSTITASSVSTQSNHPFADTRDPFPNMAYYAGLVSGDDQGNFLPLNPLTRQEMCKIIASMLESAGVVSSYTPSKNSFNGVTDAGQISNWAKDYVAFMLDCDLMNGDDSGAIRPLDPVTREEAVIVAYRCMLRFGPRLEGQIQTSLQQTKDDAGHAIQTLIKTIILPSGAIMPLAEAIAENPSAIPSPIITPPADTTPVVKDGYAPSGTPLAVKGPDGLYPLKTYSDTIVSGEAEEKERRIFGDSGTYTSAEEADAHMSEVTVNVWNVDDEGEYYPSTLTFRINTILKDDVIAIFDEIYNSPYRAPIKDVNAYAWRSAMSSGSYSDHNFGTAIDLNYNENYCVYSNGSVVGSFYDPENSIYSFPPDGIVIQTFAKYGWLWGGNAWISGTVDNMHFTYLGK